MKLTAIQANNFLGARAVDVRLVKPIALFAGANGSGKSSLQESVRMALTGESVRVSLKKDYKQLVSEGADVGYAVVDYDAGDRAAITLPNGAHEFTNDCQPPSSLAFVLDAQRFARLPDNERRAFLFGLMGLKTDGESVTPRLIAKGCNASKVEQITPYLRAGFDSAQKEAQAKARESKAAWKAATGGEAYGSVKAATWKAEKPAGVAGNAEAMRVMMAGIEGELEAGTLRLGELASWEKKCKEQSGRLAELRATAGKFARIQGKLNSDEAELKVWAAKVEETTAKASGVASKPTTFPCPCCGVILTHRLVDGLAIEYVEPESKADPEAVANLPEYQKALKLFENSVANGKRDLLSAESAARAIAEIEAAGLIEIPGEDEVIALKSLIDGLKQRRTIHLADMRAHEDSVRHSAESDKRTADAQQHHESVQQWDAIADALAPSGIPGEMLAEALGPINDRLSISSMASEWLRVAIHPDMQITYGERDFSLLSESEKWRADAMIAESVSFLSGVRLLVLDRVDVLDMTGREDLLYWLDALAEEGQLDSCLLFGTLKSLPSNLPTNIQSVWIENGTTNKLKEA
ncbi:AAA family ATPase, partial [Propionivibrio sp.]|uniref:AAA family ATPase n=1 Tax=Propionivibrio sp. TaxID=2212460 RepID=UPI003BF3A94D